MMQTNQFLSLSENRAAARSISLHAAAALSPSEADVNRRFIEPLLDMVGRGEQLTTEASDLSMGLGAARLALLVVVAAVVQALTQVLDLLGEESIDVAQARVERVQVIPSPRPRAPEWIDRAALRDILVQYFDDGELRDLCFDLRIDYESLPGRDKSDKSRELVAYTERHGRISELSATVKRLRPHAFAEGVPGVGTGAAHRLQSAPSEGSLIIYITDQDVQGLVQDTQIAGNRRRMRELVDAVNAALRDYFGNSHEG